ncbi:unnamed protein product [Adineta ricciae]|uniref:Uncharacterized protein n=1 Tax=Adineta ricciae TaxID=249248 RepID=A0A814R7C1_ADIRI|nr:unnamed protein product [Adineta ricciae]
MQPLSTLDTTKPINFDDLNIIIRSLPPRRRQSGTSIIPFRPYVKRLTSVRQPFSFANGRDGWVTTGEKVAFFKQENARCIGSLFSDCEASEVIRWDIEGESTRLPMMCKLWIIVDGAVVERGKPRMVQDAAVTVFRAGRTLLSLLTNQFQMISRSTVTRYDRRRRHSWHDVNEYHSIPYFQYTSIINPGLPQTIQCDLDNEQFKGQIQSLPFIREETTEEHYMMKLKEQKAKQTIHDQELLHDRVQISMTTQTEHALKTRSTSIDSGITLASHLNTEITESTYSIASRQSHDMATSTHDDISYSNQSISTHDGICYTNRSISTHDDLNDTHHSIAIGNDIEYSERSMSTYDDVKYSNQSCSTHDDIVYSERSMSTYDDVHYANQAVATRDDIEYADRSMSTYDDVTFTNQAVSTHDGVQYAHQSSSTHDDVGYTSQSVSTRDYIEYVNQCVSTYDDVQHSHQSVSTRDYIEYVDQSVSTGDGIRYINQAVSTHDGLQYAHQACSTHDDVAYANQSVSTRDDIVYLNQSVSTRDDIQQLHQSVSTRDYMDDTHHSIGTGSDIGYSTQSVSTRDDFQHSNQSVGTHDDIEFTDRSVSTADGIGYSDQSVATRDDMEYLNQSVSTRDDIGYSHQSVATHDDFEYLNQSVSTRDDVEYLNQSVSTQDEVQHSSRSIATGTDYPDFWLQFSTSEILSEYIIQPRKDAKSPIIVSRPSDQLTRTEVEHDIDLELERPRPPSSRSLRTPESSILSPRPSDQLTRAETEHDTDLELERPRPPSSRSLRTPESSILSPRPSDQLTRAETEHDTDLELERPRPPSSRSLRTPVSSSSVTISNRYQVVDQIDDEQTTPRALPGTSQRLDSPGDLDSHFSDMQIETSSRNSARSRRVTSSSGYNSFDLALSRRTYSTPDLDNSLPTEIPSNIEITHPAPATVSDNISSTLLQTLMERHERTVQDRRRTTAMINDELYDIGQIVQNYRERIRDPVTTNTSKTMQLNRNTVIASPKIKEDRSPSPVSSSGSSRSRYRFTSNVNTEEMLPDYIPRSRSYSRSCQETSLEPHYCEICLTDHSSGSAWIRYNEQRMERIQQRINLMLELDDVEDGQYALSTLNSTATSTQRIDDILSGRSSYRDYINYDQDDVLSSHRYDYRSTYRAKSATADSSRLTSSRKLTRSASPGLKRVRISTDDVLIPNQTRHREPIKSSKSASRPIVSILRHNSPTLPPPPSPTTIQYSRRRRETSEAWRNESNRIGLPLDQWSIPRYYRLYNDVGFREVYDFSRTLNSYSARASPRDYASMVHHYAVDHQLPAAITSPA